VRTQLLSKSTSDKVLAKIQGSGGKVIKTSSDTRTGTEAAGGAQFRQGAGGRLTAWSEYMNSE